MYTILKNKGNFEGIGSAGYKEISSMYTGAHINFGDLTPSLTYGLGGKTID
jgi:hypothetical protein